MDEERVAASVRFAEIVAAYDAAAEPERAATMAAYMKDHFQFFGLNSPARRAIDKQLTAGWPVPSERELLELLAEAWRDDHREVQYFALDFLRRHRRRLTPRSLPHLEAAICTRSWWDTVDGLATNVVGDIVHRHRDVQSLVAAWSTHDNLWMRRTAILHQLKFGADTDQRLLFRICAGRAHETEFFIRKAIGWALRQHARIEPEAVRTFLAEHHRELSGLSHREASKHL